MSASFMTLVPKIKNPQKLEEYRPISLIGCMYKLLAKVLAGRLKRVIPKIISENQNAFIGGRNILDGVVVVNEVIDMAKRLRKQCLILKVDFQKAYDSVNWNYLDYMMRRMGFNSLWRRWILECVSSNFVSILVNGSPTEEFIAQKGIKQGDPLAPFLFLIAAEGLAGLVRKGEESGCIKGFNISNNLSVSMLQFADDTIFLCDGKDRSVWGVKAVLRSFEMVSGLKVNFAKSNIVGLNLDERVVNGISSFLACKVGSVPFKFLGVPVGANPRRASTWQPVIDSMKARLSLWRSSKLSIGGRVALINSVLSSLPLYLFSMFKAPKKVIGEIQKLQRRFLWGGDDEKKKMAWVKWETVCKPKHMGGLGVKDLEVFNLALITKWRWRLISGDDTHLWKKILNSRYGSFCLWNGELPSAATMRKTSLWWRDLVLLGDGLSIGRNWFNNVTKLKLGDGSRVKFWTDIWIGNDPLAELFPSIMEACGRKECTVGEMGLWTPSGWAWIWQQTITAAAVDTETVAELSAMLLGVQLQPNVHDRFIWLPDTIRGFTVRSCYDWITNSLRGVIQQQDDPMVLACASLWKCDLPSKALIFCWRLIMNKVPTRENLLIRGVLSSVYELSCVFCFQEIESAAHVFCRCPFVRSVWRGVFLWLNLDEELEEDVITSFLQVSRSVKGKHAGRIKHIFWIASMWQIWIARNRTIFQGGVAYVNSIIYSIKYVSWSWFIARKGRNSGASFSDWCNCPIGCISLL